MKATLPDSPADDATRASLAREDFRNRVANLRIAAALTISVSRNLEAYGPQDGIELSAAKVFNRPQPATGETFSSLFTMLLQLLVYYGVLQPTRNLLRFLKIDSEVFRSRTLGEPFDGAQRADYAANSQTKIVWATRCVFIIVLMERAKRLTASINTSADNPVAIYWQ